MEMKAEIGQLTQLMQARYDKRSRSRSPPRRKEKRRRSPSYDSLEGQRQSGGEDETKKTLNRLHRQVAAEMVDAFPKEVSKDHTFLPAKQWPQKMLDKARDIFKSK